MKTSYPHRNSFTGKPKPSHRLLISCVAVFAIVWIFHGFFSSVVYRIAQPVLSVKSAAFDKLSFASEFIDSHDALVQENLALKQQVAIDSINLSESQVISMQDESLREAIGDNGTSSADALDAASLVSEKQGILANVIENPGVSPYDTLVIDAGSDQGVATGDTARIGTISIIGTVTQVFPSSSIVTLLSSSNQQIAVTVASSTPATAYGRGGGNFIITLPSSTAGEVGDPVYAPQYGEMIGKVESVDQDTADAEKDLYIAFPFPLQTIRVVTVYPSSH